MANNALNFNIGFNYDPKDADRKAQEALQRLQKTISDTKLNLNIGYIDTEKQQVQLERLRNKYQSLLSQLNDAARERVQVKIEIDKQFESDIARIKSEIERLRQVNIEIGSSNSQHKAQQIQANIEAIRQLEAEIQNINQLKIDFLNADAISSKLQALREQVSQVYSQLTNAGRSIDKNNSLNAALDKQSEKIKRVINDIAKLDRQIAQLNATGQLYNRRSELTSAGDALIQRRIKLTERLERASITGAQAQINYEKKLQAELAKSEKAELKRQRSQNAFNIQNLSDKINKLVTQLERVNRQLNTLLRQIQTNANAQTSAIDRTTSAVQRLSTATNRVSNAQIRNISTSRQVTQEYQQQASYLTRLIKCMIAYASVGAIGSFLTKVREVTAEFELQRVSLGAIIQDQAKAGALFADIKQFALQSPVSILDLTKYTKQLAAYRIETDKLFDTTKRLADVSVGLGVSMDRLVLAYGQIRATGYLRASEVRQLTEAGIPIVEELARKLSAANGELVKAADVMDMISKRQIPFELVAQVFQDMTDKGGIFYDMQVKQGNTLYGMWQKLGDAASVMYDEIGNTKTINSGMKSMIELLRTLMLNWRIVGGEILVAAGAFAAFKLNASSSATKVKALATAQNKVKQAGIAYNAVKKEEEALIKKGTAAELQSVAARKANAKAALDAAIAERTAAQATTAWGRAMNGLKDFWASNWTTIAITGIAAIGVFIAGLIEKATRLKRALSDISADRITENAESIRNFEYLANTAIDSTKTLKEQKEALAELHRTYGDMIPVEDMTIERLRAMRGNYSELTDAIEKYIAVQKRQEAESAVKDYYGEDIRSSTKSLRDLIEGDSIYALIKRAGYKDVGIKIKFQISESEFQRLLASVEKHANDVGKTSTEKLQAAFDDARIDITKLIPEKDWERLQKECEKRGADINEALMLGLLDYGRNWDFGTGDLEDLINTFESLQNELDGVREAYSALTPEAEAYNKIQKEIQDTLANTRYVDSEGNEYDKDSFIRNQMQVNLEIKKMYDGVIALIQQQNDEIRAENEKMGRELNEGVIQIEDAWVDLVDKINTNDPSKITKIQFDAIIAALQNKYPTLAKILDLIQKRYDDLVPKDITVRNTRSRLIAITEAMGGNMDRMQRYLMQGTEDMKTYREKIEDELVRLGNDIRIALYNKWQLKMLGLPTEKIDEQLKELDKKTQELKEEKAILNKLFGELPKIETKLPKQKKTKTPKTPKQHPQDNRLQNLQEIFKVLKDINKEYDEMRKYETAENASKTIKKNWENTLKYVNQLAKSLNLGEFGFPLDVNTLVKYGNTILAKIRSLKPLGDNKSAGNFRKAALELEREISKILNDVNIKEIEKNIKDLQERVSKTKTVRDFFTRMLDLTGDYNVALGVTMDLYAEAPSNASDVYYLVKELFEAAFKDKDMDIPSSIHLGFGRIDYGELLKWTEVNKDKVPEKYLTQLKKIAEDGVKESAKQIEEWYKELQKADSFTQKFVRLQTKYWNQLANIQLQLLPKDQEKELIDLWDKAFEAEETKLRYEDFKSSDMYLQLFEDMENASETSLMILRKRLEEFKDIFKQFDDPTMVKEVVKSIEQLDNAIWSKQNPLKGLKKGFTDLFKMRSQKEIDADLKTETEKLAVLYGKMAKAAERYAMAQTEVDDAQAAAIRAYKDYLEAVEAYNKAGREGADQSTLDSLYKNMKAQYGVYLDLVAKEADIEANHKENVENAKEELDTATEAYNIQDKIVEGVQAESKARKQTLDKIVASYSKLDEYRDKIKETLESVRGALASLGVKDDVLEVFDAYVNGLDSIYEGSKDLGESFKAALSGNVFEAVTKGVQGVSKIITGVSDMIYATKIARANREIERQQKLIDNLEYAYSRLEKSIDKAFGGEYIQKYNQQLANLSKQVQAYTKQAEAERSKGKKADEDKIKEFENAARDVVDEIMDMREQLQEVFAGTDITSAARDFANAWIDAYVSFEDTTEAMRQKFADMIQNMVVESLAAQLMKNILQPVYDAIDKAAADKDIREDELAHIADLAFGSIEDINSSMLILMESLKEKGLDIRNALGEANTDEYTGIMREIAGASEETMSSVAVGLNTQNFYLSQLHGDVAIIRDYVIGGTAVAETETVSVTDLVTMQNTYLQHLPEIAANTAATAQRAERAAIACEQIADNLNSVMGISGNRRALVTTM